MASRLVAHDTLPNRSPMDPRRDREWENRQMELVKCLETKLMECEQGFAQNKLTLDHYWFESVKAIEWSKHLESQLNEKDEEKTVLEKQLHEVKNQNERLHSILAQMQDVVTKKTERENSANAEILRNRQIIEELKSQIRILRDERNFDNIHVKCKRAMKKKDLKIVELESDLRRIRSNKRVIHASLQENYQVERKLQRNIRAGNETIEKLNFELDVLTAETKRKGKARDEKDLKLKRDLKSSQKLCDQLRKKVQNRSTNLERVSKQLTEHGELLAEMNRMYREQTQELDKYKEDQCSFLQHLKKLGDLVELNLPEKPEPVQMLTVVIEAVQGLLSRLEDIQQSFASMFEVGEDDFITSDTHSDDQTSATLNINTDSPDVKMEDNENIGFAENEELHEKQLLCLTHYENTSKEHSSSNIPLIDLTSDDEIDVEN